MRRVSIRGFGNRENKIILDTRNIIGQYRLSTN